MKTLFCLCVCLILCSCASDVTRMEYQLRMRELDIMAQNEGKPKTQPLLYKQTQVDGTTVEVYMPVSGQAVQRIQSSPLPRFDYTNILYPILNTVSMVAGQFFGYKSSSALYDFLSTQSRSNNITTTSNISTSDSSSKYGDYSGNGSVVGPDSSKSFVDSSTTTTWSGNTQNNVSDSFKLKTTDNSSEIKTDLNYEPIAVIQPTVIQPTVIQPYVINQAVTSP